jgi:hypothetical protein
MAMLENDNGDDSDDSLDIDQMASTLQDQIKKEKSELPSDQK